MKKNISILFFCIMVAFLGCSCNDDAPLGDLCPYSIVIVKFADENMKDYIPACRAMCVRLAKNEDVIHNIGDYIVPSFDGCSESGYEILKSGNVCYELHDGYYVYKMAMLQQDACNAYPTIFKFEDIEDIKDIVGDFPEVNLDVDPHFVAIDEKYLQRNKIFKEVVYIDYYELKSFHKSRNMYVCDDLLFSFIEEQTLTIPDGDVLVWCYDATNRNDKIQRRYNDVLQEELDIFNEFIDSGFSEKCCTKFEVQE